MEIDQELLQEVRSILVPEWEGTDEYEIIDGTGRVLLTLRLQREEVDVLNGTDINQRAIKELFQHWNVDGLKEGG